MDYNQHTVEYTPPHQETCNLYAEQTPPEGIATCYKSSYWT